MKIAFYQMRPFDEQAYIEQFSREFGIDYVTIPGAPCPENLDKAAGCDAVSHESLRNSARVRRGLARMGVKYLPCRSIGYDHIPLDTAKKLGMRISPQPLPAGRCGKLYHHVDFDVYPQDEPNHACAPTCRTTRCPARWAAISPTAQWASLAPARSASTVVAQFAAVSAARFWPTTCTTSDAVAEMAQSYVPLDELYARSDVITLHTNATAENHHLINAESLAKMKDGVLSVNTARGALIDAEALD